MHCHKTENCSTNDFTGAPHPSSLSKPMLVRGNCSICFDVTARATLQVGHRPFWYQALVCFQRRPDKGLISSWTVPFPPLLKDNFGWVTTFGWDRNCPWHVKRTHPPTTPLSRDSHTNIKLINTFNIKQIHVSHVQWDITGKRHVKIETDLWFWHCLGWGLSCYVWRCGLAGAGFKHSTHS